MENPHYFKCDYCGRFIAYKDFEEKKAFCYMVTPESDCSYETWLTYHQKCKEKENINLSIN